MKYIYDATGKLLPEEPIVEEQKIPIMTHPLSSAWSQPDSQQILIDNEYALMPKSFPSSLMDYSMSYPSGVYSGKMWKRLDPQWGWLLFWYGPSEKGPEYCSTNYRKILVV